MYSKFTLPLWAIIILLTSGCQNSKAISASPISTPVVIASPVKSLAPKTGTGEPITVGSPKTVETLPVMPPLPELTSTIDPPAVLNKAPIVSPSLTPTPFPPRLTPTYTPYHPPTRVPIETAIHIALKADVRTERDWLTYTDPVSGLSFQYPPDWEIVKSETGKSVKFLQDELGHFISLSIQENPDNLTSFEYLSKEILRDDVEYARKTQIRKFSGNGFDGATFQERDSNVVTYVVVNYEKVTIRIVLMIRGTIGGFPMPSNDYSGTEQEIFKLINTLQKQ